MRLVLYNPHIDDFFLKPLLYHLFGRRPLLKYGNVLEEMKNVGIFIDYTESGIIPYRIFRFLPRFFRKILLNIEIYFWKKFNPKYIFIDEVQKTDVLLIMSYKSCHNMPAERLKSLSRFSNVVVHLSHYFVNTLKKSENIQRIKGVTLAGDSDITQNDYFQHFFWWYKKPLMILPFAVAERWMEGSSNKLNYDFIATGTIHDLEKERPKRYYKDYINFTQLNNYHPRREEARKYFLENNWTCYVNEYRSNKWGVLGLLLKRLIISQKEYFRVNLVTEYCRHSFAIIGEERTGFPPLGVFEAMACGCIVIIDPSKYHGLDLIPGQNCLEMRRNIEESVKLAQSLSTDEVERISNNAKIEARNKWNAPYIASRWNSQLNKLNNY